MIAQSRLLRPDDSCMFENRSSGSPRQQGSLDDQDAPTTMVSTQDAESSPSPTAVDCQAAGWTLVVFPDSSSSPPPPPCQSPSPFCSSPPPCPPPPPCCQAPPRTCSAPQHPSSPPFSCSRDHLRGRLEPLMRIFSRNRLQTSSTPSLQSDFFSAKTRTDRFSKCRQVSRW